MATLLYAKRIVWKVYYPLKYDCSMPWCENRATITVGLIDDMSGKDKVLQFIVCPVCLHRLGASGLAAAMEE